MGGDVKILWVDDEIEHLKAHLLFLRSKGFWVVAATNGNDALEWIEKEDFDLLLLDEHMPGLSGLETLQYVKNKRPELPIIMITKSEEEDIMEQAIGSKIADYIIKPANPIQILSSIKRILDRNKLVSKTTTQAFQTSFKGLSRQIDSCRTFSDWVNVYQQLAFWEMELQVAGKVMDEVLQSQKKDANRVFYKFVQEKYPHWIADQSGPLLSHRLLPGRIFPMLDKGDSVCFVVIDNFRYDQWLMIRKELVPYFHLNEELYFSILPTSTQYARNAIFSGLLPLQISKMYPDLWDVSEEQSCNANESVLMERLFERHRRTERVSYFKISNSETGREVMSRLSNHSKNTFHAFVFNFIDMLSHARSELKIIKELATDEAAFRGITATWFRHSTLFDLLRTLGERQMKIVLTTDHGTIRVGKPRQISADKDVNANLRFKVGRKMNFDSKNVFEVAKPETFGLPSPNLTSSYLFAGNDDFFVYPNQFHHYSAQYKDTFQHGGISMEEVIVPFITLEPRALR